ncbi:MAG TPA: SDR family NAD(P)-dependent oxidoreductase [Streptosporangiaceae bacterium]|nr:SDR family NAD(P)-dependent oxidoreductase [Streptosporangiaceae bacterium]
MISNGNSPPLSGRIAWVTGGASGIGAAVCGALMAAGAEVGILDLPGTSAPDSAHIAYCDLSDEATVHRATQELTSRLGQPDIVINNAGISLVGSVPSLSSADWDKVLRVNLYGAFFVTKRALPGMLERKWGRVVSVSSGTAIRVQAGRAAYAASKAGLIAFTKVVAAEGAPHGVTANVVAPGITDTPMTRQAIGSRSQLEAIARDSPIANPMGTVLTPEDIAQAILFFVSPGSGHTTGQVLHVSAGSVMG